MLSHLFSAILIGSTTVTASPALVSRAGVTPLSEEQVATFKPYALLARAAFCPRNRLETWSCGTACNDLPGMESVTAEESLTDAGWFVGYYPQFETIVVSNQGTEPNEIISSLTDADFFLAPLEPSLFPGVPNQVQVHDGFQRSQAGSAQAKLDVVNALIAKYGSSSVTLTGLGRGGAISLIDALYFSFQLPTSIKLKVVTHGMPRVGNLKFAEYIDTHLSDVSRVTNKHDPLPTLPGRFLGYSHTSGSLLP
ncbi:unnamed protein product [Rhizoctonia solani]|uniref:Fungal lipase-type domain-containing protein n=1 Tax=Rhizoctonia solani TaxID=456999 RepID=A0A8H3BVH6_9AGAM|nr:unnamed protein product [Rhizoctonia solani]